MAFGGIVASNDVILDVITYWYDALNAGSELRLFQNALAPTPANVLADFTEATFTGYASIDLTGLLGAQALVVAGEYQSAIPTQNFSCTGGARKPFTGTTSSTKPTSGFLRLSRCRCT